jgi:hypothetical protein
MITVVSGLPRSGTSLMTQMLMQDFLQYLSIAGQTLPNRYETFQNQLRVCLVRMGRACQVHRNIGIDKDHFR